MTASAGTFPGLAEALHAIRVVVEEHPLTNFTSPKDWGPLDAALGRLDTYGTVALTSPRAATAVIDRIGRRQTSFESGAASPAVWTGGPATAAALGNTLGPVRTPNESDTARWGAAGALARAMLDAGVSGRVLFPCGETRRDELPERLRNAGVEVDEVVCYRSILANEPEARKAGARGTLLVVASPSVADLLARACPPETRPDLVAVGPTTAAAARRSGWTPAAVAEQPSVEALVAAVQGLLQSRHPAA